MKRIITFTLACILLLTVQARAEITPQLLQEWSRQPNNVQWNVFYQNTFIEVVNELPWVSPSLYDTYAYTTMNVEQGNVKTINMVIKKNYEFALTHEVGHCVSNYAHIPYWWCYQPVFTVIWQNERYNNALMTQGIDDIREYFACAYDLYIRYPQILKQANPMTYNYIVNVLHYT